MSIVTDGCSVQYLLMHMEGMYVNEWSHGVNYKLLQIKYSKSHISRSRTNQIFTLVRLLLGPDCF